MSCGRISHPSNRREFLRTAGCGFGAVAASALLKGADLAGARPLESSAARIPHHAGRARNVIWLFMEGGPSHLDLFDPKPLLNELAGQSLPGSFERPVTAMGEQGSPLLASPRTWKQCGQGGLWISDWLPHHEGIADELCVIRSCVSDGINHAGGVCQMNTGSVFGGRPSLGSWVSYGLGTRNANLPGFVVIKDTDAMVVNGVRNWGQGFLPAVHQGTLFEAGAQPIRHLNNPKGVSDERQAHKLDFLNALNRNHQDGRESNSELEARIRSYELTGRMQMEAPEAVDLGSESAATRTLYGLDRKETSIFGRQCLLARRLVERGVRFVQLYHGAGSKWDSHDNIEPNHTRLCQAVDFPIAGLIRDLRQRGLLDETLVIWGGEFGRTPMSEKGDGRDHNPTGFTIWMAGGGVKGGVSYGESDEVGHKAAVDKVHVNDFHATILHLLGFDHEQLTYRYGGRDFRLTDVAGQVIAPILA